MRLFKIDDKDTVAVALEKIPADEKIQQEGKLLTAKEEIPAGHKVALRDMKKGEAVIKYGWTIGEAACDIEKGQWVHTHNLLSRADDLKSFTYHPQELKELREDGKNLTFYGYRRKSGETGVRNYIAVISGVFCANPHIKAIAQEANRRFPKTENFDGFLPLTHECGCGQEGQDLINVRKILMGILQNPNFGGVLFVQVGCEINQLDTILPYGEFSDEERLRCFTMQQTEDEMETGLALAEELYQIALRDRRSKRPVSELHLGFNCGGSDGFSGLTANRLLGRLAEFFCGAGATVTITEVTEMFGAEQILMNRAVDREIFEKIKELLRRHREYILKYGGTANGNPSYGNKKGGLSTIEDKSLGCIQKGGDCPVADVVFYGDRVKTEGFQLVQGPGSDLIGVTGQIAAGAVMEIFTTGRGTPVAFAAPTMKVSTNTQIFEKKRKWMDFNAGVLLEGETMENLLQSFVELVLKAASGEYATSNERAGFFEMAILRDGVIL